MANHEAKVVRIEEIFPHKNADSLGLVYVGGFQVVVRLDQFKVGDLAVYVQPDSIVPEIPQFKFVWERDGAGQPREWKETESPTPEKWRRVTVRKFRKEWSEGLLMPIQDFGMEDFTGKSFEYVDASGNKGVHEGDDAASILGITHWNPPEEQEERPSSRKQSRTRPRSLKGWFHFIKNWAIRIGTLGLYDPWGNCGGANEKAPNNTPPVYDVENYKHYKDVFVQSEEVVVTEKIHGSNARYLYQPGLLGTEGKMFVGSRQLWKKPGSTNVWRKILDFTPDLEKWCRENPNVTIYGEVVPTQGGFEYGHTKERPHFYAFDIRMPDGTWLDYDIARASTAGLDIEWAPLLYKGPYDFEKISKLVDGQTSTGAKHIREGIVVKTLPERHERGLGRVQLKLVSNKYLEKS